MSALSRGPLVLRWPATRRVPPPREDGVHVWCASRDVASPRQRELEALLDDTERERARRFLRDELARRFAAGRGILREILGAYLRADPRSLRFDVEERGKPFLRDAELQFSLSDSGPMLAVAVTAIGAVGVDVERIEHPRDLDELMERTLSARELAWCRAFGPEGCLAPFYRIWTRKEALLKATGEGISRELRAIDVVADDARGSPSVRRDGEREEPGAAPWRLVDFEPADGYVGAVALRSGVFELTTAAWGDAPLGPSDR
jgi:4'-phosphopantetheinyl transferase